MPSIAEPSASKQRYADVSIQHQSEIPHTTDDDDDDDARHSTLRARALLERNRNRRRRTRHRETTPPRHVGHAPPPSPPRHRRRGTAPSRSVGRRQRSRLHVRRTFAVPSPFRFAAHLTDGRTRFSTGRVDLLPRATRRTTFGQRRGGRRGSLDRVGQRSVQRRRRTSVVRPSAGVKTWVATPAYVRFRYGLVFVFFFLDNIIRLQRNSGNCGGWRIRFPATVTRHTKPSESSENSGRPRYLVVPEVVPDTQSTPTATSHAFHQRYYRDTPLGFIIFYLFSSLPPQSITIDERPLLTDFSYYGRYAVT